MPPGGGDATVDVVVATGVLVGVAVGGRRVRVGVCVACNVGMSVGVSTGETSASGVSVLVTCGTILAAVAGGPSEVSTGVGIWVASTSSNGVPVVTRGVMIERPLTRPNR
jgi:hypothetical protein